MSKQFNLKKGVVNNIVVYVDANNFSSYLDENMREFIDENLSKFKPYIQSKYTLNESMLIEILSCYFGYPISSNDARLIMANLGVQAKYNLNENLAVYPISVNIRELLK